jgi:hypothetical protein
MTDFEVNQLRLALKQLVASALHTEQGPLGPGGITFFADPMGPHDDCATKVFVDIEAYDVPDRGPAEARSDAIRLALRELFPNLTFSIWVKLENAGWSSDVNDPPPFEGGVTMQGAIDRALVDMGMK